MPPLLLSLTAAPLAVGHPAPLGRQHHIRLRQPRFGEAVTDKLDLNAPGHRAARPSARDTPRPRQLSPRSTTRHRPARSRKPAISDGANLTVNTTVRSGTT